MKKRALTLIEVIISLVILGVILSTLFGFFRQMLTKNVETKKVKQQVLQLELFHQRLKQLFSHLPKQGSLWLQEHRDAKGKALCFFYIQEADPNPDFCGQLLGMVYLNRQGNICFANWPNAGSPRIEILVEHALSFQCQVFDPHEAVWTTHWKKSEDKLPEMLKISYTTKENPRQEIPFLFFISHSIEPINYTPSL